VKASVELFVETSIFRRDTQKTAVIEIVNTELLFERLNHSRVIWLPAHFPTDPIIEHALNMSEGDSRMTLAAVLLGLDALLAEPQ
jgi:hypothetical protein